MSINLQGKKCVVCNAYLFPEDDVVFCPTCGAPHHRDCYASVGHCGLEELHGTENQYNEKVLEPQDEVKAEPEKAETKNLCHICKKELDNDAEFCPYCGTPKRGKTPFEQLGDFFQVDPNAEIDDGVIVKDAAPVILANQARYIPRFINLKNGAKSSWNWAAFLFPHVWFAFRKMYSVCWAVSIGFIISTLLSAPFTLAINSFASDTTLSAEMLLENLPAIHPSALILAFIGFSLDVLIRIFGGLFGDKIYRKHVSSVVKEVKNSEDKDEALRKKGGVSLFIPLLVMLVVSYLPSIIFAFIKGI